MHDKFDGIDIVRNDHQLRLFLLHHGRDLHYKISSVECWHFAQVCCRYNPKNHLHYHFNHHYRIESGPDDRSPFGGSHLLPVDFLLGLAQSTRILRLLALRTVLVQKFDHLERSRAGL